MTIERYLGCAESAVLLLGKPIRLQFSDIPRDIYCNATCYYQIYRITANDYTKDTAKFLLYQDKYCHQRCSTESRIQRINLMLFQNFLNTWWDHEIADSAQPRYRSIVSHQTLFPPCEGGVWTRD